MNTPDALKKEIHRMIEVMKPVVMATYYPDMALSTRVTIDKPSDYFVDEQGCLVYPWCKINDAFWWVYRACLYPVHGGAPATRYEELLEVLGGIPGSGYPQEATRSEAMQLAYNTLLITPGGKLALKNPVYVAEMVDRITGRYEQDIVDFSEWDDGEAASETYNDPADWEPLNGSVLRVKAIEFYARHFTKGHDFASEVYERFALLCHNHQGVDNGENRFFRMSLHQVVRVFIAAVVTPPHKVI